MLMMIKIKNEHENEGSSSHDTKKEEESDDKKDKEEPHERRPSKRLKTNEATTTTTTTTTGDVRDMGKAREKAMVRVIVMIVDQQQQCPSYQQEISSMK